LSIVKKIVEAHFGSIAVEDGPGRGARFIMRFPLVGGASGQTIMPAEK
jgi:signal transduction histidine kinase